jgi:hypothetical protein
LEVSSHFTDWTLVWTLLAETGILDTLKTNQNPLTFK